MNFIFQKQDDKHTAITFTHEHIRETLEYWTKERMENAIPDICELPDSPDQDGVSCGSADARSDALPVKDADTSIMPFNAGGKLFFTCNGTDYVASAEFCADKQIVLTAAHCFYDRESHGWSANIIFRRCYDNGSEAQVVAIQSVAVDSRYISGSRSEAYAYDYAFGVTEVEAKSECLNYEIDNISGKAVAYGYPSNYNKGKKMVYVEGDYRKHKDGILEMLGNSMGGGCSGGPWVKAGANTVVSVNSYSYTSHLDDQYGPAFTKDFEVLLDYAKTLILPVNTIRYYKLHNAAAVVARIQIEWVLGKNSGIAEESGYHDICAAGERTVDMVQSAVPNGATVRLKANVPLGDDDTADEEFVFDSRASKTAYYKLTGTAFKTNLSLQSVDC